MPANEGGDKARPTHRSLNWVWDTGLLKWVMETQPSGGGGGGAVTIADGADTAEGTTTDVAVQGDNPGTISAKLRGLNKSIATGIPVTGTFFQVTQPVSIAAAVAVTNTGLSNLDVALSTRLKPADTLAAVTTVGTITNPVAVTNASLDGTTLATIDTDIKTGIVLAAGTHVIGHVIVDSGAITATVTNDGTFAKETGGNLATIATNTTGAAKDASLTTIDTDLKATQPRSITNFPATQAVSVSSGSDVDLNVLLSIQQDIRAELRVMSEILANTLNFRDSLDDLRKDMYELNSGGGGNN